MCLHWAPKGPVMLYKKDHTVLQQRDNLLSHVPLGTRIFVILGL